MGNNLHISYDLLVPGQNYERTINAIKALGAWAHIHKSYWFVNTSFTAPQACDHIWKVMDSTDSLYVVDATNRQASWRNITPEVQKFILDQWVK